MRLVFHPFILQKKVFISFFVLVSLLGLQLLTGCKLGSKQPKFESAQFDPSGHILACTYSSIFILQYSRKGNMVRQQGIISYYLTLLEPVSGKNLLAKPYKSKMRLEVLYNDGVNVWLQSMDTKKGEIGLAIFNIANQKMAFTMEELDHLNQGIKLNTGNSIYVDEKEGRVAALATDGRYYIVNAQSGKYTLLENEDLVRNTTSSKAEQTGFKAFYAPIVLSQLADDIEGYRGTSSERGQITYGKQLSSKETFLDPGFVLAEPGFSNVTHNELMDYKHHLFVCSKITTDNNRDLLLTMVRRSDLNSVWTLTLPQLPDDQNTYTKPIFQLAGDTLYVVNSSYLITVDATAGKIISTQLLFK